MSKKKKEPKRRNPHAIAAWNRKGGAHDPGTKKPEESFEEYMESWDEEEEEQEDLEELERISKPRLTVDIQSFITWRNHG